MKRIEYKVSLIKSELTTLTKYCLPCFDNKIYILDDGIKT